ncbi:nucleotidyltransferase-like protein [Paenibacillus sp. FA6]|uniref:nucleotidyltransferase-like protein n=1 Tax=Paenibacillus sp. FA6 TaxID=3413029 RepID=UPI003F657EBB
MFLHYKDALDEESIGAFAYVQQDDKLQGPLFRDFEIQLLVVQELEQSYSKINHVMYGDMRCQIVRISYKELRGKLVACEKSDLVKCLLKGELIADTDDRLSNLRLEFQEFMQPLRDQKMFLEFSRFLRLYLEAKRYMGEGHVMDAYHSVTESLHHWARIELIERGIRPESHVWEQVRGLNTAVHKLYEELTVSKETVQQRVELVLLGCEFSVLSKMGECSSLLISVIGSRNKPWSIEELIEHPELEMVSDELPLVLRKLVYRSKIKEVQALSSVGINSKRDILYSTI